MSRKLSLIILISLVFLASISAISAADENNDTISACEYDTSTDLNTNNLNFDDNSLSSTNLEELKSTNRDEKNLENTQDQKLNSNENSTQISTDNTNIVKTNDFTVTLTDSEGNGISNQSVIFNLENTNYTKTTDENGAANLKIDLTPGTYEVTVYYPGNSTYSPSTASYNITCYQIASKIVTPSTSLLRRNYFTMYLYDASNNPISGQTVTFKLNGNTYTRTTNSKGAASLQISQNAGKYGMTISYAGEGTYKSAAKTVTVTSYRLATKITPASKRIVKGNYFTATLKDKNGKVLSGQKVIIKYPIRNIQKPPIPKVRQA